MQRRRGSVCPAVASIWDIPVKSKGKPFGKTVAISLSTWFW